MVEDDEHMQNFETASQKEEEASGAGESATGESASSAPTTAETKEEQPVEGTIASEKVADDKEVAKELEDEFVKLESLKESYAWVCQSGVDTRRLKSTGAATSTWCFMQ